jgi:uncharacterized membrane protein
MPFDTYLVVAATYASEDDAFADYDAAKALYSELGLVDTYDAAVLTKTDAGKVKIVKKHEQPTRTGAWGGLGVGLVGGALVALFSRGRRGRRAAVGRRGRGCARRARGPRRRRHVAQ